MRIPKCQQILAATFVWKNSVTLSVEAPAN